jgi:hypothetical protein
MASPTISASPDARTIRCTSQRYAQARATSSVILPR